MSENLVTDNDYRYLKPPLDRLDAVCFAARLGSFPSRTWLLVVVCLAGLTTGCVSKTLNQQMERVAKDWSMVIRASQVIPVYPLTEDLVPGDIFLVEQTREEQVRQYQAAGFLPLDHHLYRLPLGSDSKYPATDSPKAETPSGYDPTKPLRYDAFYSSNP